MFWGTSLILQTPPPYSQIQQCLPLQLRREPALAPPRMLNTSSFAASRTTPTRRRSRSATTSCPCSCTRYDCQPHAHEISCRLCCKQSLSLTAQTELACDAHHVDSMRRTKTRTPKPNRSSNESRKRMR